MNNPDPAREAVHQCMCIDEDDVPNGPRDVWMDVSAEAYASISVRSDVRSRIVYTAPCPSQLSASDELKAAYLLLESQTTPGTYGRSCIEALKDIAFPEIKAAKDAARTDHCPYCLGWQGGPLLCCNAGYLNTENRQSITKAEADLRRLAGDSQ